MRRRRKPGILVVDDVDDTRELFAEVLMAEGYHSIMARNGVEALARMDAVLPDVVVTDLMMPEMGGADLLRTMRENERLRDIPVILLTGSDKHVVLEALADEAPRVWRILRKPISIGALLSEVDAALAQHPPEPV